MAQAIFQYALLVSFLTNHHIASATLANRTIDDQYGDPIAGTYPVYSPPEDWRPGANCSDCSVRPEVNSTFDGTWHDSTYYPGDAPRTVTVTFSGSAVYAFFITSPVMNASITTETHLNFTLDNQLSGTFNFVPYGSDTYTYNHSVFSKTGLSSSQHTLVMSTGGTQPGLLEFDYVVYTVDTDNTTSGSPSSQISGGSSKKKSPNIGAIAGGVIGGVALFTTLAILFFLYRKKAVKRHSEIDPQTREHTRVEQPPADLVIPYAVDDSEASPTTYSNSNSKSQNRLIQPLLSPAPSSITPSSSSPTTSFPSTKSLAQTRQGEVSRRMQAMEQQMTAHMQGGDGEEDWRTTAQHLRAEIGRLEVALQSQWAQGMSDRPPPEYLERPP